MAIGSGWLVVLVILAKCYARHCPEGCSCLFLAHYATCHGRLSSDTIATVCQFVSHLDVRHATMTMKSLEDLVRDCPKLEELDHDPVDGRCPPLPGLIVRCGGEERGRRSTLHPRPAVVPPTEAPGLDRDADATPGLDHAKLAGGTSGATILLAVVIAIVVYRCCCRGQCCRCDRRPREFADYLKDIRRANRRRKPDPRFSIEDMDAVDNEEVNTAQAEAQRIAEECAATNDRLRLDLRKVKAELTRMRAELRFVRADVNRVEFKRERPRVEQQAASDDGQIATDLSFDPMIMPQDG